MVTACPRSANRLASLRLVLTRPIVPLARIRTDPTSGRVLEDPPSRSDSPREDGFGCGHCVVDSGVLTNSSRDLDCAVDEVVPICGSDGEVPEADFLMQRRNNLVVVVGMHDAVEADTDFVRDGHGVLIDPVVHDQIGSIVLECAVAVEPQWPGFLSARADLEVLLCVGDRSIEVRSVCVESLQHVSEVMTEHLDGPPHLGSADEDEDVAVRPAVGVSDGPWAQYAIQRLHPQACSIRLHPTLEPAVCNVVPSMAWDDHPTLVISIDLEMSWGSVHHGRPHDVSPYSAERSIVDRVLQSMAEHEIEATWAIVGHLYLDHCERNGNHRPHPEITPPSYRWMEGDWYDLDPGTNVTSDPTWYGPDLVEAIERCRVPQEIGSHSFGHLIVGDPDCTEEAFASDLEAAIAVSVARGRRPTSFVYPRNAIGHLDVLSRAGFTSFRGPRPEGPGPIRPSMVDDLVDVPQTYLFDPDSAKARRMGTALWSRNVTHRLRRAVADRSLFHLWFHTHNLAQNPHRAFAALNRLLAEARRMIDAGDLRNSSMGQVTEIMHR